MNPPNQAPSQLTLTGRLEPGSLIPRLEWHPYPTIVDRGEWSSLPSTVRQELLLRAEKSFGVEWPILPASLYLEFSRDGNRSHYEAPYFLRRSILVDLVLGECVEAQGRFLDDIANGIWAVCEETSWCIPAHIGAQKAGVGLPDVSEPVVDLFAAETAALLAWTAYLLEDRLKAVSPLLLKRLHSEVQQRMLDPCLQRDDFYWMGFDPDSRPVNNWNPWVNSNWLAASLLLETDEAHREQAAKKVLRSLDYFLEVYGDSGGCDEGPGYWGRAAASLFDCLELLYLATGGKLDVYNEEKVANMGRFIYRTQIHGDDYVNFADASATNQPVGSLVFRYGERINDPAMTAFGAWLVQRCGPAQIEHIASLGRILPGFFSLERILAAHPAQPLPGDAWFDDIQVLVARDREGSADGFFLAAKGGHNAESHNHNDIGSFIVYIDGKPLIVDAGVETYSRKTFSPQRYEIWTMQSAYHSLLPSFQRGETWIQQAPGREFTARDVDYEQDGTFARLSLDIAPAYPSEAGVRSWKRSISLECGEAVVVMDQFSLEKEALIQLSFLTPCEIGTGRPGRISLVSREIAPGRDSASGKVIYPEEAFLVRVETINIDDARLSPVWGERLNRVTLTTRQPVASGEWVPNGDWEFRIERV